MIDNIYKLAVLFFFCSTASAQTLKVKLSPAAVYYKDTIPYKRNGIMAHKYDVFILRKSLPQWGMFLATLQKDTVYLFIGDVVRTSEYNKYFYTNFAKPFLKQ